MAAVLGGSGTLVIFYITRYYCTDIYSYGLIDLYVTYNISNRSDLHCIPTYQQSQIHNLECLEVYCVVSGYDTTANAQSCNFTQRILSRTLVVARKILSTSYRYVFTSCGMHLCVNYFLDLFLDFEPASCGNLNVPAFHVESCDEMTLLWY